MNLAAFAAEIVAIAWDGGDADGATIQTIAEDHGLIVRTEYDPAIHGPSDICEPGDEWFIYSEEFKAAIGKPSFEDVGELLIGF